MAWVNELPRQPRCPQQPANFVQDCMNNAGARFLKYLMVRHLVSEELVWHNMLKDGSDQLLIFDEYLIHDRFHWLWSDIGNMPEKDLRYLELDPVHPGNTEIFSKWDALENAQLLMAERNSHRLEGQKAPGSRRNDTPSRITQTPHLDLGKYPPL